MTNAVFTEDLAIAKKLILRDEVVTRDYFYCQCYPLFKSIFDHFYTDCESCIEFINQMYMVVLYPSKKTGRCQMENYRGESTLTSWLKSSCLFYCYGRYKKKTRLQVVSLENELEKEGGGDRLLYNGNSIDPILNTLNNSDLEVLIKLMPNKRYQQIIRYIYIEQLPIKETAKILGIKIDTFYGKHALAKAQLFKVKREEEHHA